jgi:hypothetical protein
MNVELLDERSLFEKMMNHFGWYKTQMSDVKIDKLEVDYRFIIEVPKELQDAINQEQVTESSKRKYTKRSTSGKASKASSSNSIKRTTSSTKKG